MEELIDEFLEELIDKKEITANERTDMKLTLLEAMPKEMTAETKTRVMSSLKSKMETPSANIFTDKGVNIVAVRTIANESVKEVVEAVEKEEQAKEEAEAKRDAKVAEALDTTILEADKKSEENQNKENENNFDDVYDSQVFGNISKEAVVNAFENLKAQMGDRHSDETLIKVAEAEVAFEELNQNVAQLMNEQGISQEEAMQTIVGDKSGEGQQDEKQKRLFEAVARKKFRKYAMIALEEGRTIDEAIEFVSNEHKGEFLGISDMDGIIQGCRKFLESYTKKQIKEAFEIRKEAAVLSLKIYVLEEMLSGKSFEEAAAIVGKKYDSDYSMIRDINVLLEEVYNSFINEGYSKEQLESGTLTAEEANRIVANQPLNEGEIQEGEPQGPNPMLGSVVSNELPTVGTQAVARDIVLRNVNTIAVKSATIMKMEAILLSKNEDDKEIEAIEAEYDRKDAKKTSSQNIIQYSTSRKEILKIVKGRAKQNESKIKEIRKIELKKKNEGTLSEKRKNIIRQRERFLNKAIKLYLSSEKTVYDIMEELGEYAEKYEIIPSDIIDAVHKKIGKISKREADILKTHEEKIIMYNESIKSAKIALNNAINSNENNIINSIADEIAGIEASIKMSKDIVNIQKRSYGSLNMADNATLEHNLKSSIKDSIDYTKQMEHLRDMQIIYTELRNIKRDEKESFNSVAIKFFASKMVSAEKFGPKLLNVLKEQENNPKAEITLELLEDCIKDYNEIYMQTINRNIESINKDIEMDKNATRDEGFTDALLEKDKLERELKKAEERDYILRNGQLAASRVKKFDQRVQAIRSCVVEYYTENVNAADLIKKYKDKGISIDINDLLKGIVELAIKSGVDEEKIKLLSKNEKEIYRNYIRMDGINILKGNAERQSKEADNIGLNYRANLIQRDIDARMEETTEVRAVVNEKFPDLAHKYDFNRKKAREQAGLTNVIKAPSPARKSTLLKSERKTYIVNRKKGITEQEIPEEQPKKGIGMMNVAKILETSGTTSQEIVGEVTDLNKIARSQDERGMAAEQRDA